MSSRGRPKSPIRSVQLRFTVPSCDNDVLSWAKNQYNLSNSVRTLIKNFIASYGHADCTCVSPMVIIPQEAHSNVAVDTALAVDSIDLTKDLNTQVVISDTNSIDVDELSSFNEEKNEAENGIEVENKIKTELQGNPETVKKVVQAEEKLAETSVTVSMSENIIDDNSDAASMLASLMNT